LAGKTAICGIGNIISERKKTPSMQNFYHFAEAKLPFVAK